MVGSEKARTEIIRLLNENGEFPAMAETVLRVNKLTADEDASAGELAKAILDDYALTNKVLRVVNSAVYGRSTEVTTVSRAIVVLGWNPIRSLVLTFKLFDALPDSPSKDDVKNLMGESFCTGMVARTVAESLEAVREEQAFICGLFHQFGQLLVHFYLPEAKQQILQLIHSRNKKPTSAARLVLGMTYAELGVSVAEELHFPKLLTACMNPKPRPRIKGRPTPSECLTGLAALSGRVKTALLAETPPLATQAAVSTLVEGFEKTYGPIGVTPEIIVTKTLEELEEHASILGLPIRSRALVNQIARSYFTRPADVLPERMGKEAELEQEPAATPEAIFEAGIKETTGTGVRSLNDIVLVVLETLFRGLSFAPVARAVFFIRDPSEPMLRYRSGLGDDLERAEAWFAVPLERGGDIFNLAMSERKDLIISDISAIGAAAAYPAVFQSKAIGRGYVALLPIVIRDRAIGLFFVEGRAPYEIEPEHLALMKKLRDQVVRRIEQASLVAA